jgi:hypothetical protein
MAALCVILGCHANMCILSAYLFGGCYIWYCCGCNSEMVEYSTVSMGVEILLGFQCTLVLLLVPNNDKYAVERFVVPVLE